MKEGKTLQALAAEIDRQRNTRKDYIAPDSKIKAIVTADDALTAAIEGWGWPKELNEVAHEQVASRLQIPQKYYDRMRSENHTLWAQNVNGWLGQSTSRRMVRTINGTIRAFLSDRYRPLDNYELLEAILPALADTELKVESCEVTDRRLYLKAVNKKVEGEVKKGDIIQAGVMVSNSEVGMGSLSVTPLLYRLACLNGMVVNENGNKRRHTGGRLEGDENGQIWADDTRKANDKALWLQTRDLVSNAVSEAGFNRNMDKLREAAGIPIQGKLEAVVDVTAEMMGWHEGERDGVLANLIKGGDLSAYGLANATTLLAQMVSDYDRSTELERQGGQIIELPASHFIGR